MEESLEINIAEMEKLDFPVAVLKIHANLYDALEGIRSKKQSYGVNVASIAAFKKAFDYISERTIGIFKQNATLVTKVAEMESQGRKYADLAEKVARLSTERPPQRGHYWARREDLHRTMFRLLLLPQTRVRTWRH